MSKNKKLILTQIMKNESHVIERMLDSIKDIIDVVSFIDTGSTDDTIEKVHKWGKKNNIPTYIEVRDFDNFENSRNASIDYAKKITEELSENNTEWYGMWLDCDEKIIIDKKIFNKQSLDKDLYMISTTIGKMEYTRNEVYKLNKGFTFYGPVHEFLIPPKDKDDNPIKVSGEILKGLKVFVYTDGASWKDGTVEKKYRDHAQILEEYINYVNRDPRWIFYTAQSYHDSAIIPNNREENLERYRRSLKYYKERVSIVQGYPEERYYSQYRISTVMKMMDEPWSDVLSAALKAYEMDNSRGESIEMIIKHYQSVGNWNLAYLYSKFAMESFHDNSPYPGKLLFVDGNLYKWRFLRYHSHNCFYTNRKVEAKKYFSELLSISKKSPELFNNNELNQIKNNEKSFTQI